MYLAPIKFKQENKRTVFSLNEQISRNIYLPEFIKRYLQKSQVGFNNFIPEVSKKQLKVASYGLKRTNQSLETLEKSLLAKATDL